MVTGLAGGPLGRLPAMPARAILSSVASPAGSMVPKTVLCGSISESWKINANWLPLVLGPSVAITTVPRGYSSVARSAGSSGRYWLAGYSSANS